MKRDPLWSDGEKGPSLCFSGEKGSLCSSGEKGPPIAQTVKGSSLFCSCDKGTPFALQVKRVPPSVPHLILRLTGYLIGPHVKRHSPLVLKWIVRPFWSSDEKVLKTKGCTLLTWKPNEDYFHLRTKGRELLTFHIVTKGETLFTRGPKRGHLFSFYSFRRIGTRELLTISIQEIIIMVYSEVYP